MKKLRGCAAASCVALVSAVVWYFTIAPNECFKEPFLQRHKPEKVALGPRADEDPWPMKLGNKLRTSFSNRTGPRDITQPRWSFHIPDIMYNTPLIDKSGNLYIFLMGGWVVSLDPNGETRWWFSQGRPMPSNAAMESGVLFFTAGGFAHALSTETGFPIWTKQFAPRESAGNPAVTLGDGLLIVHFQIGGTTEWTEESEFVALESKSGMEVWRSRVDTSFFNVIMAFADDGASVVFTDQTGGTHKMETKTGKLIWSTPGFPFPLTRENQWNDPFGGAPRSHSALALVDHRRGVVYGGGNPTRRTGRVRALSLETGKELWRRDVEGMLGNNGALADIDGVSTLVFGGGIPCLHPIPESTPPFRGWVYGLNPDTGEIRWTFEAEPHLGRVAAGSVLDPRCFKINLPDAWNSPTIDGSGTVYIGWHGGIIYALDHRNGALISEWRAASGPQAQCAIGPSGELIVVGALWVASIWPDGA